ncbi:tetratricopeptide repeat protein [Bradymonas sediminis]|uniref:Uncharacterized protein n=1 Tax=Bradymonas sediminis TaxID=1548548 RepID=A0A2Z4FJT6_9DELT|nr:tetratricopeptide repeat protein [Bradymonas sediminis]AWV88944.1 hypothetical protein DN745_06150 [Bradymonas sediminis]TDP71953.1 hypothetical protein DFR33_108167 [Bradymonas sediminis]
MSAITPRKTSHLLLVSALATGALGLGLSGCSSQSPAQVSKDSTDSEKSIEPTSKTRPTPPPVEPKLSAEAEKYLEDARAELDAKEFSAARAMIELSATQDAAGQPVFHSKARALLAELERAVADKAVEDGDLQKAYEHRRLAAEAEPAPALGSKDLVQAILVGQQIGVMAEELAPMASQAVDLQTSNAEAQTLAAQLWDDAAEPARALPYYQWLYKVSPDNITASTRLATILLEEQKIQDARRLFEEIYQAHPDHIIAGIQLADIYATLGTHDRANAVYEELLAAQPESSGILMRYARYLEGRGEHERAAAMKARAQANMPGIKKKKMRKLR